MTKTTYEVLDRPEVVSVLFYPRRDIGVPRVAERALTVQIPVADDVTLGGKIFLAEEAGPVILLFHGNGEIAADYDTIAPLYTRFGVTLFVVDYRGYGTSEGRPTATTMIEDACSLWRELPGILTKAGISATDIFVMGRSLGSAPALEVIDRAKGEVAGLILESAFAYTFPLIERIGFLQVADAYEHRDGFGNIDKIAGADLPTLIIHGERDWIIPISDSEALYEASPAANKSLVRIAGAGHNDLMMVGEQAYFSAIASFCRKSKASGPA